MPLVLIGVLLLAAKMAGIGPTAEWSWWVVLAPVVVAVIWWQVSDSLGLTQKRAIERMEDRKVARREKAMVSLGLKSDARARGKSGGAPSHEVLDHQRGGKLTDPFATPPPAAPLSDPRPQRDPTAADRREPRL